MQKRAPIAECREVAEGEVQDQLFFGEGARGNAARELFLQRQPHVTKVYQNQHGTPAFALAGTEVLHSPDGRVVKGPQAVAILSCSDVSQKKLDVSRVERLE